MLLHAVFYNYHDNAVSYFYSIIIRIYQEIKKLLSYDVTKSLCMRDNHIRNHQADILMLPTFQLRLIVMRDYDERV